MIGDEAKVLFADLALVRERRLRDLIEDLERVALVLGGLRDHEVFDPIVYVVEDAAALLHEIGSRELRRDGRA